MKYKLIKAAAHNFSHSFLDDLAVNDMKKLAIKAEGERVVISWIPVEEPPPSFTPQLNESIARYREYLNTHFESEKVDVSRIREFRTEMYMQVSRQLQAEAVVIDDRGKEHRCQVKF